MAFVHHTHHSGTSVVGYLSMCAPGVSKVTGVLTSVYERNINQDVLRKIKEKIVLSPVYYIFTA